MPTSTASRSSAPWRTRPVDADALLARARRPDEPASAASLTGVPLHRDPRRFREADWPAAGARGGDGGARGAVTGQAAAIGLNDLRNSRSLWQSVNSW